MYHCSVAALLFIEALDKKLFHLLLHQIGRCPLFTDLKNWNWKLFLLIWLSWNQTLIIGKASVHVQLHNFIMHICICSYFHIGQWLYCVLSAMGNSLYNSLYGYAYPPALQAAIQLPGDLRPKCYCKEKRRESQASPGNDPNECRGIVRQGNSWIILLKWCNKWRFWLYLINQ